MWSSEVSLEQGKVVSREEEGSGEGVEAPLISDTLRYINLVEIDIGLVALCGPMYLCACETKRCGDRVSPDICVFYFHQNKKRRGSREGKCHDETMMRQRVNERIK